MSRWLWALLGVVVLVGIAAVFWIASRQTNVSAPVSSGPVSVAPAPVPPCRGPGRPETRARSAPAPAAQEHALPLPRLRRHLRPRPRRRAAAPPAPTAPPAPAPAPSPVTPSAPPSVAQQPPPPPAPAPLAEAPLPPPAPGREAPEAQGEYAPKSLAQLVGTWAYYAEDCERLFERRGGGRAYRQPVDKFAQAAIVEPKRVRFAFRHLPGRGRV